MFVQISLDMRYTIEVTSGEPNQDVCDYLKIVPLDASREDVAANLIGFPGATQLKQEVTELTRQELFEIVEYENTMSTLAIRLKLLDSTEDTHHTLIEEGL